MGLNRLLVVNNLRTPEIMSEMYKGSVLYYRIRQIIFTDRI